MTGALDRFEQIVRASPAPPQAPCPELDPISTDVHPFESRNIHPDFPTKVRRLFDNGFFAEATFEAFKWVDQEVRRLSGSGKYGQAMMMDVFNEQAPTLALNALVEQSEIDEQLGYKFIFAGSQSAIRNPRGHGADLEDSPDQCLDHLALASLLVRRLDDAGLRLST